MVAEGTQAYTCGLDTCKGSGYVWSQQETDAALESDVAQIVRDDAGLADCLSLFDAGTTTDFEMERLRTVFSVDEGTIKNWQVGEALACAYLESHRDCLIPWNTQRDLRTPRASLPGVDICGIRSFEGSDQFFFCEVKTSTDKHYPPHVASQNPHSGGLIAQVEELCDNESIRNTVIRYLAIRAKGATWQGRFCNAAKGYVNAEKRMSVFGFLVRDVEPNVKDLKKRVTDFGESPEGFHVEFLALYLPLDQIQHLAEAVSGLTTQARGTTC